MLKAIKQAKRDEWSRTIGGFAIAQMPDGKYTYFYAGIPPHIVKDGNIIKCGKIVCQYQLVNNEWRKISGGDNQ